MVEFSTSQAIPSTPTTQTPTTTTTAQDKTGTCSASQQEDCATVHIPRSAAAAQADAGEPSRASASASVSALVAVEDPQASTSASAYQLRALNSATPTSGEENLWSSNFNVPSLSADLIDETLNYFVNCRQRLSQITKTFDDSDAYILLLQEKEMDLELVARIGQDLLKQFNEVKDSNEGLKDELAKFHELNERLKTELAKCQEDNQQLKYELASKASLLDTFLEEEEHQHHQDTAGALNRSDANEEEFTSLRSQSDRVTSTNESNLYKRLCELQDELLTKDEVLFKQNLAQQERNLHLEMQLRESERRLSGLEAENETLRENQKELYEELKTYSRNFAELLRIFSESQRESRMHDIGNISFDSFTEPPPSFDSHLNSTVNFVTENLHYDTQLHHQQTTTTGNQPNHNHHQQPHPNNLQPTCQQRIVRPPLVQDGGSNMVVSSSLHEEMQETLIKPGDLCGVLGDDDDDDDDDVDADNLDCDENNEADDEIRRVTPRSPGARHHRNYYNHHARAHQTNLSPRRGHQTTDSDSGGVSDGTDSGLHTTNISTSTTPINNGLNLDTDSEDSTRGGAGSSSSGCSTTSSGSEDIRAKHRKNWLGLSTFTLTTLLLLCLSATLNTSANSNLAHKLQMIKFDP